VTLPVHFALAPESQNQKVLQQPKSRQVHDPIGTRGSAVYTA
jgi:hypothetical protein